MRQLADSHNPMVLAQSRLSTGSQGSGRPRIRNSGAMNRPRASMRAFTPLAYASSNARASSGKAAKSVAARWRKPMVRMDRSIGRVIAPAISDSRPDAARRINSIWNMRSRACR